MNTAAIPRLLQLQAENDAAGAEMLIESARFDRIRGTVPRSVSSFNLFQTPEGVAGRMAGLLPTWAAAGASRRILEPSAGLGRLVAAVRRRYPIASVTMVENNPDCAGELYRKYPDGELLQRDFLTVPIVPEYDGIIMNPPFKQGRDIKHIKHAAEFLAPGGRLVAICADGPRQWEQLQPLAATWEPLLAGTFKESGTMVNTVLLTIEN